MIDPQATEIIEQNPSAEEVVEQIRWLLSKLPPEEQERVLRAALEAIRPIYTPRAGELLGLLARLLPRRPEWTVADVKQHVASEGVEATAKAVYNALGYLTRKGYVRRIGYGRYLVDGIALETADDLGGPPPRYED